MLERADVGARSAFFKLLADCVAVVATVGEQHHALADTVEHVLGRLAVMGLAGRELQRDRQAVAVYERMDLGRIPAAGTAHAIAEPPFLSPLAACWWTLTVVESIIWMRPS
jgi:hypothetical protein